MAQGGDDDEQAARIEASAVASFERADEPLAAVAADGRIRAINRRLREQLGPDAEAWIGRPATAWIADGSDRQERAAVSERLQALDELAAGLAHSFNNTLTSVLAHTQVLARSAGLPEWAREDLDVIEQVAREAAAKVRQVQGFARSRAPAEATASDLGEALATAIARTRPRWNPPDQPGRWSLDWSCGPTALPIAADAATLAQVLAELLHAGIAALPEGGALTITTGRDEAWVWVQLRCRECPGELDLAALTHSGAVAAIGGELHALTHDERGRGVVLRLPLAGGEAGAAEARSAGPRAPTSTVLLVEDDATVRRSITSMLAELGHRCVAVGDGREALRLLDERDDIDVLITDLAMPNLDGRALLRDVGRRFPALPRVLVTGLATDGDTNLHHGPAAADAILTKPVELTALEGALARVLTRPRARRT